MGGGYYHAQFKKPAEEALQPCQINSGITRRSAMSTFPGEMLGTNDQSPEHVANNMDARRHTLEMFSSPRNAEGVPLCFSSDSNRTQNIDCESKTSEQQDFTNKQYLYEREYERTPGIFNHIECGLLHTEPRASIPPKNWVGESLGVVSYSRLRTYHKSQVYHL
jgi:hypothetical protein